MAADLAQYDIDLSCYDWLKQKLSIIDAEGQWKDALHADPVTKLFDKRVMRLFVYVSGDQLVMSENVPAEWSKMLCFVRDPVKHITAANISQIGRASCRERV